MDRMAIRAAERSEEEWLRLRQLYLAGRQQTFDWLDTASYRLADFDRDTEGEYILVAVYKGVIAGFISLWLAENFIHHLYVNEAFHNRGIGSLLLAAAIGVTGFPVRLKCLEKNARAIFFYTAKGFVGVDTGVSEEGENVLMELNE